MADRGRRKSAPSAASTLVSEALAAWGVTPAMREVRIVTEWRQLVGDRIAGKAWPDSLKNGILRVRVASSSWMHELGFLREALVKKINAVVGGPPLVKDIRFWMGGREQASRDEEDIIAALTRAAPKKAGRRREVKLGKDVEARIEAESAGVRDPELKDLIVALRRRLGM